ncbi:MAG: hypothetical protein WAV13_04230, partial [Thermodesulfovibrionales bacterium]
MAKLGGLSNFWNTVKEVDLRPLRDQALRPVRIVLVGEPDSGVLELARRMVQDPARPELESLITLPVVGLEQAQQAIEAELLVLVIRGGEETAPGYTELVQSWSQANRNVIVFFNYSPESVQAAGTAWLSWGQRRVIYGSVEDTRLLLDTFAAAVLDLLPDKHLSLGRHYPLLRVPAARRLINDTCV